MDIRKNWKYLVIGGGVIVLTIVLIVVFNQPGPDISGRYELLLEGRRTETVVEISSGGDVFHVKFMDHDSLRSEYVLPKPRGNRFKIEKTADGQAGITYELEVVKGGLKGKADIPALADDIEVFFRRIEQ